MEWIQRVSTNKQLDHTQMPTKLQVIMTHVSVCTSKSKCVAYLVYYKYVNRCIKLQHMSTRYVDLQQLVSLQTEWQLFLSARLLQTVCSEGNIVRNM